MEISYKQHRNKYLYKYVSSPNQFLDGFYIRATQISALNDPFEAAFSQSGVKQIHSLYDIRLYDKFIFDENKYKYGVVCLSESRDNLLMWSHYANEHKGCVLGFTIANPNTNNRFDKHYKFFENYNDCEKMGFDGEFQHVEYRKQRRYGHDFFESTLTDTDYSEDESVFLREVLQVKSDEWAYEKEHRAILPLAEADKIVVPIELCENFNHFLIELKAYDFCEFDFKQKTIAFDMLKMELKQREELGRFLSLSAENPRIIFLFKVSELCLNSITFGLRSSFDCLYEPETRYFEKEYPRFYQAITSTDYFALEFEQILLDAK